MGFFKRDRSAGSPHVPQEPSPIDRAQIDLNEARSVVTRLCQAIGDSNRMWVAVSGLRAASGMPDTEDAFKTMEAFRREGPSSTTKLWRWLVAAAERANEVGEHDVAAMAYYWATEWIHNVQPTLGGGGAIQLGFDRAPEGTYPALAREADKALSHLPDDFVIAATSEPATITRGALAPVVAEQLALGGDYSFEVAMQRTMNRLASEASAHPDPPSNELP